VLPSDLSDFAIGCASYHQNAKNGLASSLFSISCGLLLLTLGHSRPRSPLIHGILFAPRFFPGAITRVLRRAPSASAADAGLGIGGLRLTIAAFARAPFAGLILACPANTAEQPAALVARFVHANSALSFYFFLLCGRQSH